MTKELKPCPFCGDERIFIGWTRSITAAVGDDVKMGVYYKIGCKCGASIVVRMRNHDDDEIDFPTATEAAKIATERWNKRTYCTDDNPTMNI